ncbi:hypothetical protein LCGC14_0467220 [marine sediment metagenome]|uniref:LamG-like jellyroll fold domain-containing protein n=1 Tax=marine sediment metagenome TaxID=412755 RepID=A0A0F9SIJ5_9ZZZZ
MSNLYKPTRHDQSIALGASALYSPLTVGLVAYWRMEESAWEGSIGEVKDSSGKSGPVSQNLILNSNDLTAAGWSSSGTPIVTSTTLEDDDAGAMEGVLFTVNPIEDEDFYTMSCKVPIKGSAPSYYAGIMIWLYIGGTSIQAGITIDPYNKTITSKSTGGGTVAPYATSIEEVGTDLLVSLTLQNNGTSNTFARADYYPAVNTDGSGTWLVTAQGINTFTDMQLENSSALGPFVATTGSAITNNYNHGKAVNGVTTIAGGKLGRSGSFDGINQYLSFGLTTMLDGAKAFTINIWVKADTIPFVGGIVSGERGVFARGGLNKRTPWLWGVNAESYLRLHITTTTGGTTDGGVRTADLTQDTWHMVTFTWDGTNLIPYLDLVAGTPDTTTGNILADADIEDRIGYLNGLGYWDGMIDEVAVWNRVLDMNEIEKIHNAGLALAIV